MDPSKSVGKTPVHGSSHPQQEVSPASSNRSKGSKGKKGTSAGSKKSTHSSDTMAASTGSKGSRKSRPAAPPAPSSVSSKGSGPKLPDLGDELFANLDGEYGGFPEMDPKQLAGEMQAALAASNGTQLPSLGHELFAGPESNPTWSWSPAGKGLADMAAEAAKSGKPPSA